MPKKMSFSKLRAAAVIPALFAGYLGLATSAHAVPFSFAVTGALSNDADVETETVTLPFSATYRFRTVSYAGGTLANGVTLPSGGFDPILTLFAGIGVAGSPLAFNDDGGSNVPADPVTGAHFDSWIVTNLAAGTYTIAISEFPNFWNGSSWNITDPNYTAVYGCSQGQFCDVTGANRTAQKGFDITLVPEPASLALLGTALVGLLPMLRRRREDGLTG